MTSQGHPYARFRRALAGGNPTLALTAAAELHTVTLQDALALTLLLAVRGDAGRFSRAAIRWHARFCREAAGVGLDDSLTVLALLTALRAPEKATPLKVLGAFFDARGDRELGAVARRQLVEMQPSR